jgi:hypothetical protein
MSKTVNLKFDSLESLFDQIGGKPRFKNASSRKPGAWSGTKSFTECQSFAQHGGWDAANEAADQAVAAITAKVRETVQPQATRVYASSGAFPVVSLAIAGNPAHMIRPVPDMNAGRAKTVRVLLNVCCSGGVSTDVMIRRGVAYAALVEIIQSLGYSVDLWVGTAMAGRYGGTGRFNTAWRVKAAGGVLDRDRLLFNVANPSNLRRIGFAVMETMSKADRDTFGVRVGGGYGMPDKFTTDFIDSIKPDVVADAAIMLGSRGHGDPVAWVIDTLSGLDLLG